MYLTYYADLVGINKVIDCENARSGKFHNICRVFGHKEMLHLMHVNYAVQ